LPSAIKENTISIAFVGDIAPGLNAPENLFSNVVSFTDKPDVMIGNLEGVITESKYLKCKPNSSNCFSFNGDGNFIRLLSDASFDVLNVANNHFNDFGKEGQTETVQKIREAG